MPNQRQNVSIEANFTGGLKTEFTGLNFPENSCTAVDNCVFSIVGDVLRREGINFEANNVLNSVVSSGDAINQYRWKNAGGDGQTEVLVVQVGGTLYFFKSSASTIASPLSAQILVSTVTISTFLAQGSSNVVTGVECQFSDGNGYLFVYHPYCDPFYCTFNAGTITPMVITVQTRDFNGIYEPGVPANFRPLTLTPEHNYNLVNQGWIQGNPWSATSTTAITFTGGAKTIVLSPASIAGISNGEGIQITGVTAGGFPLSIIGTVSSYSTPDLVFNLTTVYSGTVGATYSGITWSVSPYNLGVITTFFNDVGVYPSNADIWWEYKDSSGVFNPSTTLSNVTLANANAPQGHILLNAFNQTRSATSGITGLTNVTTTTRPQTGAWFQGRVWYAGVNAAQPATGDAQFYTWSENLYFSQIISDVTDFGNCYQYNDPTDENLFEILPTDGGVITIQGSGAIYKLFPIQNGMLVFAANGVWFITGSSGIGFSATDYVVTKISAVQSISGISIVDVNGLPIFWNEEGIYAVEPTQKQGYGLAVNPLTVGTILSFYNQIPLASKQFARGAYNPVTYIVQWTYRSTVETSVTTRYQYDSMLSLNIFNKAFYPYTVSSNSNCFIAGMVYMNYPPGSVTPANAPDPQFKYLTLVTGTELTFAEENDSVTYLDWYAYDTTGVNYTSYFITGYKLHGQGLRLWQPGYIYMYSRNDSPTAYTIQGIWDYASTGDNSGKYSNPQVVNNTLTQFGMVVRRHRIRGHGLALQLYISSVQGLPFDIMGWSTWETSNVSI